MSGATIAGAGLYDCQGAGNKLTYNNATKKFTCEADQGGSGISQSAGDARYVNTSGDTMTGGLLIQNGGTPGIIDTGLLLEIIGTASGRVLHAQDLLSSSGALVVQGIATFKSNVFIRGALSGAVLHAESLLTSSGTLVVDGKAIISAEDASAYTLDLLQLTVNPATTGTFAGDALQITMDATDANGYTGDGLKFIVDQSQINGPGRIIAIDDDAGAEIFAINKYGFVKTERGYVSYDGFMGEDFNDERGSVAADTTTRGDNQNWVFDEGATSTCTDIVAEGSVSFDRMTSTAAGGCFLFMGIAAGDIQQFTNAANLPRMLLKIRPGRAASDAHTWAGLSIGGTAGNTEPTEGIYFTNAGGNTWTGRVNPASGGSTDVVCTGETISTTNFAALEIIVESSTLVRFKIDSDLSNGINFVDCGTADPSGVTSNLGAGVLLGTSVATSFTMDTDYVRVWTDDPKTSVQSSVQSDETPTPLDLATSADLAEAYPAINAASFGAGELVAIDEKGDGSVRRSKGVYDRNLMGVVSASPYDVMGAQSENTVPIALAGRVPVKVTTENGPIAPGDPLTSSSIPGIAMRASKAGPIIGKAMQAFDGTGEGIIMVFVYAGDYAGDGLLLHSSGATMSTGGFQSTAADYAEWFKAEQSDLQVGEILCLDSTKPQTVQRCANEAHENIVGIVSPRADVVGNDFAGAQGLPVPGHILVALMGKTSVKVTVENGAAIRIGDALTSSNTPGFARKALPGEPTIGVALDAFDGASKNTGTIAVLISRKNKSVTMEAIEKKILDSIASMGLTEQMQSMIAQSIDTLDFGLEIKEEVRQQLLNLYLSEPQHTETGSTVPSLAELLSHARTFSGSTVFAGDVDARGSLSVRGELTVTEMLRAGHLTASGNLTVAGSARFVGDTYIEGALTVRELVVPDAFRVYGDMTVNGFLQAYHLSASSGATIRGSVDINVQTGSILIDTGSIRIGSGTLLIGSGSINVSDLIVRQALLLHGDITVDGLATFLGTVDIQGDLILSERQAGYAEIRAGSKSVTVLFGTGFTALPIVTATPTGFIDVPWWVPVPTATGFTIQLAKPVSQTVVFSWHALLTRSPLTSIGDTAEGLQDFPVDALGVPVSSNDAWNACIRNQTLLDSEGQPFNCSRYHEEDRWTHPDLLIEFFYDSEKNPPLILPEGYRIVVVEVTPEEPQPSAGDAAESGSGIQIPDEEDTAPQTQTGAAVGSGEDVSEEEGAHVGEESEPADNGEVPGPEQGVPLDGEAGLPTEESDEPGEDADADEDSQDAAGPPTEETGNDSVTTDESTATPENQSDATIDDGGGQSDPAAGAHGG